MIKHYHVTVFVIMRMQISGELDAPHLFFTLFINFWLTSISKKRILNSRREVKANRKELQMEYRIINDLVVVGNKVYAKNLRNTEGKLVAEGLYSERIDDAGMPYRVTETIITVDGECVEIK